MLKAKGSEHSKHKRTYMKNVKHFSSRKDRGRTRQLLNSQRYDDIPLNQRTKEDDPWNWD